MHLCTVTQQTHSNSRTLNSLSPLGLQTKNKHLKHRVRHASKVRTGDKLLEKTRSPGAEEVGMQNIVSTNVKVNVHSFLAITMLTRNLIAPLYIVYRQATGKKGEQKVEWR